MKCIKCESPSFTKLLTSNTPLCRKHYIEHIEKKVRYAIKKHKMFSYDDKIAVAYSGGKDSTVLLHVLYKIEQNYPKSELFAIIVDEGISGYRDQALRIALKNVKQLGIPYKIVSFKNLFTYTLDEIVLEVKQTPKKLTACTYCGVFRRRAIDIGAKSLGATKVATGHNLDDEVQTFLLNLIRGDVKRIGRLSPAYSGMDVFIPRVKPLRYVSEREIVLYALAKNLEFHSDPCPYSSSSTRNEVREFINKTEIRIPSVRENLLAAFDIISPLLRKNSSDVTIKRCKKCGAPTSSDLCQVCKLLETIPKMRNFNIVKKMTSSK